MAKRKSFTHLDVDDRTMTQAYLNQGLSLAKLMATISRRSREKKERNLVRTGSYSYPKCGCLYNHKLAVPVQVDHTASIIELNIE